MNKTRGETVSEAREPYAIVNGCDGGGFITLIGVYPNNSKRGDFSIYSILAQIVNGVQIGFIKPRFNVADCWELATQDGNYAIRITLAEALVLFLDPLVARTKELPPEAIPVIRWWQQHRRPGPQRCEDLVMPLLKKRELARIAENTPEKTEEERKALTEHHEKFTEHFLSIVLFKTWFLGEAELEEMGVTAISSATEIMERWLKSEKLLQLHTQMTAHMRLLYKLGEEHPDLADLWSKEVNIQIDLGRFLDSGLAYCVFSYTSQIHQENSKIEPSYRFFLTADLEDGWTVLRGMGAWSSCVVNQRSSDEVCLPIWEGIHRETYRFLIAGVSNIFLQLQGRLPKFDATQTIEDSLTQLLLQRFNDWNTMYVYRREGPLASADKDPPSDFVTDILNLINEEKSLEDHAQAVSGAISRAFWDVACMAIHPEVFDYPAENDGLGVRKTTPVAIAPSRPRSFEEALPLLVAAFCSRGSWLGRFSRAKPPTLKKCLTVTVHPPETASVQRTLCPRHFSLDEETMVPSDELLQHATNRDDRYFTNLFKLMAVQLPHTTLKVLVGVQLLLAKLTSIDKKAITKLEANRGTSTTKMPKEQCAGCGSKEETERRPMKCSRCEIARYCSVACQKKHWPVHKKVCAPINKK
jgi:hypothetical protein